MKYIKDYNCWSMGIGDTDAIEIFGHLIELIPLHHIIRIYRNRSKQYSRDAWKCVVSELIHKKPIGMDE